MTTWKGLVGAAFAIGSVLAHDVASAQVAIEPPQIQIVQALTTERRVRFNSVVTNAPYSADVTATVTQVLADGTRIQQSVSGRVYRDVAGRMRREQQVLGLDALNATANPTAIVTITDPTTRTTYTLNDQARTATKAAYQQVLQWNTPARWNTPYFNRGIVDLLDPATPQLAAVRLPPGQATGGDLILAISDLSLRLRERVTVPDAGAGQGVRQGGGGGRGARGGGNAPAPPAAAAPESLGSRQMEGVAATGNRWTQTIPTGQIGNDRPIAITDEIWESPELQVTVYSKHHDPRTGDVEYRLRNISRNEPPAALFQVPAGYTIVDPLQPYAGAVGGRGGRGGAPAAPGGPQTAPPNAPRAPGQ